MKNEKEVPKIVIFLSIVLLMLLCLGGSAQEEDYTPPDPCTLDDVDCGIELNVELVEEFPERRTGIKTTGTASWYGGGEPLNVHTANGEVFDTNTFTCSLPEWTGKYFNKEVLVKNLRNGKTTTCRVNDIGPAKRLNRIIDVTSAVKKELEMGGLEEVEITILN